MMVLVRAGSVITLCGAAVVAMAASVAGASGSPAAAPPGATTARAWGPVRAVPLDPSGAAVGRDALARTVRSGRTLLHVVGIAGPVGSTDRIRYVRSSTGGSTWSAPVWVSPRGQVAGSAVVAASGRSVHVAWLRRTGAGFALYVRTNRASGSSSAWTPPVRLNRASASLGPPSVSAVGSTVYVAVQTGRSIVLRTSRDDGRTWRRTVLSTDPGRTPDVAAAGAVAAVVWARPGSPERVVARISRDHGRTWGPARTLGSGAVPSVDVRRGAVSVAAGGLTSSAWLRSWRSGTWRTRHAVPTAGSALPVVPVVVRRGAHQVGVTFARTLRVEDGVEPVTDVTWTQSADGGVHWSPVELVSDPRWNGIGAPSVLWRSDGGLYLLWPDPFPAPGAGSVQLRARR